MITFDAIYNKYYYKVCGYCFKYMPKPSWHVAEEMADDVMLKVSGKVDTFENWYAVMRFIFVCSKNKVINQWEKKYPIIEPLTDTQEMEYNYMKCEVLERILEEIEKLPSKRKAIFKMAYLEDMTMQQLVVFTGLKEQTIKNQLHNALKQLRMCFNIKAINYRSGGLHANNLHHKKFYQ